MCEENLKLLEENGWTVECQSPLEISHESGAFATLYAVDYIIHGLSIEKDNLFGKLNLIKNAYEAKLIDGDKFISEVIKVIEK
jgi:hypothetical protein